MSGLGSIVKCLIFFQESLLNTKKKFLKGTGLGVVEVLI